MKKFLYASILSLFLIIGLIFMRSSVKALDAECPTQYPSAQNCPSGYTYLGGGGILSCTTGFCCPSGYQATTGTGGKAYCCNGRIAWKYGIGGIILRAACCPSGTVPQNNFTNISYACKNTSTNEYSSGISFFTQADQQSGYECKKGNYCPAGSCWVSCTNLSEKYRCAHSGSVVVVNGNNKYCNGSDGNWVDEGGDVTPPGTSNPDVPAVAPVTCEQNCGGNTDCNTCCTNGNVWTEIGCISPTQNGVVIAVMRVFMGVVTGLIVLRFIQAGFMLNTDDPEKIKEGKNIAMSAVLALVFGSLIIVILNFIGVKVLDIGEIIR